jgi:hypothetical protein
MSSSAVVSFSTPASVVAGTPFSVTLTLQNTGTDTWAPAATLNATSGVKLGSATPHDTSAWGPHRVLVPAVSVPPAASVDIVINAVAAAAGNDQNFDWQLVQEGVAWFGVVAHAVIDVAAAPPPPPPEPTPLSEVLGAQRSALETVSGKVLSSRTPCVWDSGVYVADGTWRSKDFVNDLDGPLELVQSYLWTGIQTGGVCDTHVQVTAVDLDGEERLVNLIQWDHYAEPTTFQGRFQQPPFPVVIQPGELLRFGYFTAPMGGKVAQHIGDLWFLRG